MHSQLANSQEQYHFQPSLVLYDQLSQDEFETAVVVTDTGAGPGTVLMVAVRQTVGGMREGVPVGGW